MKKGTTPALRRGLGVAQGMSGAGTAGGRRNRDNPKKGGKPPEAAAAGADDNAK